MSHIKFS